MCLRRIPCVLTLPAGTARKPILLALYTCLRVPIRQFFGTCCPHLFKGVCQILANADPRPPFMGWASRLSTLDGTYMVQLPRTLRYGKAFSLPFAVARNKELSLTSGATFIGPGGKPEYLTAAGFGIGDHFIAADTRNAGCIVPAKASADPDAMLKRRVLKEKRVSIFKSSFQGFALSAMN